MNRLLSLSLIVLFSLSSCVRKNPRADIDVSNSSVKPVNIIRFDKDFFALDTTDVAGGLKSLEAKYGDFASLYLHRIIGIPPMSNDTNEVHRFLTHAAYRELYSDCEKEYTSITDVEESLSLAFKRVNTVFPNIKIPTVYSHFSGFGEYIVVTDSIVSISLDYYLGKDYENYKYVDGIFDYMLLNLRREKISSDLVFWWLTTEFPYENDTPQLLSNMIYYGKIMYLTEIFLQEQDEYTLMGYSKEQWDWCEANESKMWNYLLENKLLFSTDALTTAKFINPAPFTSFFPEDSPGRTGIWIGWQIVRAYMENNPNVSLADLMKNNNGQMILENSNYRP